jgi:hypothetical protein
MDFIFDNNIAIFIVTMIFVSLYCFVLNNTDPEDDLLSEIVAEEKTEKHRCGDELRQRIQRRMA